MPQKGDTQINNFVRGLITEASPLSFPPGASLDEENFKLKRDGSRERRLGLDYEENYTLHNTTLSNNKLSVFRKRAFVWPNPSGSDKVEIGVIQIGTRLYFINLYTENPSANLLNGGNYLDASTVSDIINETSIFDFAILNNNLIVVSEGLDTPFLLSYDDETDTISTETARIKIRDLYGVEDSLGDDERPITLTDAHEYNLRNQGWDEEIVTKNGAEVLQETKNVIEVYPSNSDVWSLGKIADVTSADIDKYDAETLKRNSFDLGRAAKGHFIIDLYDRGNSRNTESGIPIANSDRELGRISTVATLGGRIFYSGIRSRVVNPDRSPKLSGAVLFSQIARNNIDLVKCYQEADPTSPNNSDIVDTDGGVIQITEASNIVDIRSIRGSIIVFAENGVWEIRGDDGGFRATSFQVNKISSIGVISKDSIVEANGVIFFWGREGIFSLTPNQLDTGYDTTNITIATIQSAYNTIPDLTKQNARGYYDVSNNRVRWLFNSQFPIPSPDPDVVSFSIASTVDETGSEPKVAKINSNTSIVIYKQGSSIEIFYRILTLNDDLTVTVGSELSVVSTSPNPLAGYDIIGLQDNKVLCVYQDSSNNTNVIVGNWDGSTMTFTSPTTTTTSFRPTVVSRQLRLAKINSGRVVIGGVFVTSFRPGAQVVDIDSSDNITFGTIANTSTEGNISNPRITMLTSTKGVMCWNGGINPGFEVFTISGTTITFNGTKYSFPNATQYPSASSFGLTNTSISAVDSNTIFAIGEGTIVEGGVTTYAPIAFNISEASGVLTSTTAFQDTDHNNGGSASTTRYFTSIAEGDISIGIACSSALSPNQLWFTKYTGVTPAQEYDLELEDGYSGSDSARHPDVVFMGDGKYIVVVWTTTTDSTIDAYGVSAT